MKKLWLILFFIISNPAVSEAAKLFPAGQKPSLFVLVLVVLGSVLAALALHELGHLITGLVQGFTFQLFVVGPLGIKREEGKIKVYLNKNIGLMGGVAAVTPVAGMADKRKKFARLILAGPLASLILGGLLMLAGQWGPPMVRLILTTTGATSAAIFLATTLPRKTGIYFTDRARYQRLMSKGQAGKSEEAFLELIGQSMTDNHSKNIDVADALTLQKDDEPFMRFWGYYYEYVFYKENEVREKEGMALEKLLENKGLVSKEVWKMLKIEDGMEPKNL